MYDSPAWQWGPGICTKHRGQDLPCRVCIEGHDPDLQRSGEQEATTRSEKSEMVAAKRPTLSEAIQLGRELYQRKVDRQNWIALVIRTILYTVPESQRDEPKCGLTIASDLWIKGPWDEAKTWNEMLTELRKCLDSPSDSREQLRLFKEQVEEALSRQNQWAMSDWPNLYKKYGFVNRKPGIPLHNIQSTSADLSGSLWGRMATLDDWKAGESADIYDRLPVTLRLAVLDVRRQYLSVRTSVLVRAANLTMARKSISLDIMPIESYEREAVSVVIKKVEEYLARGGRQSSTS